MITRRLSMVAVLALSALFLASAAPFHDPFRETTEEIASEIVSHGRAFADLSELTAKGPRLCGSESAERAVEWARTKMESYGLKVSLQPVTVPHWTRGNVERAAALDTTGEVSLSVTALGLSVGTPDGGIEAPVVEVKSLDEVGEAARGKIVFYNRPMDASLPNTFDAYGGAVDQRTSGASRAARFGAVAVLVRSLTTLPDDDHPHTGMVYYRPGTSRIPAAAVSTHGANTLSRLLAANPELKVRLELSSALQGQVVSHNVIGEIPGAERAGEYVVVGGHLDSWDLGTGAQDDGAGAVQSIEALRAIRTLGLHPRRTLRAVLFMCEEIGGFGGVEYAKQAKARGERHLVATESDRGGFAPVGFTVDGGGEAALEAVKRWIPYLTPLHAGAVSLGGSGSDIEPLNALGTTTIGFIPESRHYFDFHHSSLDRIEAVNAAELHAGAAAMAVLTFLASESL